MQTTDFSEKWTALFNCLSKPLSDFTQLNINTFTDWTRNTSAFNDLSQVKKPEELLAAQAKLANETAKATGVYAQKACEIWRDAAAETGEILNAIFVQASQWKK